MDIARLVARLRGASINALTEAAMVNATVTYTFDPALSEDAPHVSNEAVRKTHARTVVSAELGTFQAREVVRESSGDGTVGIRRSDQLSGIVPKGQRYAYDMIAEVGRQVFLEGRSLSDIQRTRFPDVSMSSLWDIEQKFLFFLGALHQAARPVLRRLFDGQDRVTWLIDGTLEPGSPVFFGAREASSGIMLACHKIPSENVNDIADMLGSVAADFGTPDSIVHDLNANIATACEQALSTVPHHVCHYHFLAVLGRQLYEKPQAQLIKRVRALKLMVHLREQRKNLTGTLRQRLREGDAELMLKDLLRGDRCKVPWTDSLAREILLALQFRLLDYSADGSRQGYPFDPYQLLFHRRVGSVHHTVRRLLEHPDVAPRLPQGFTTFADKLDAYLHDSAVVEAAACYEEAEKVFHLVRDTLHFDIDSVNPMRATHDMPSEAMEAVADALAQLRHDFSVEEQSAQPSERRASCHVAIELLEKYRQLLIPPLDDGQPVDTVVRTTAALESDWCDRKRNRRKTHGRGKLTRDFISLPPEVMLVGNLRNQTYIDTVLGSIERLPEKLADAGRNAGTFSRWRSQWKQDNVGRLPKKILRMSGLNEKLVDLSLTAT